MIRIAEIRRPVSAGSSTRRTSRRQTVRRAVVTGMAATSAVLLAAGGSARASNTPSQVLSAYGIGTVQTTDGLTGSGQTIAIYTSLYYTGLQTDVTNFSNEYMSGKSTSVVVTNTSGVALTSNTSTGTSAELALDVEYAHLIAPNATIHVVYSTSSTSAATYAANTLKASVFSSSYGTHNTDESASYETSTNATYQAINTKGGTTVLSAAGDSGVLDYPAASPYSVAVGATNLTTSSGKYLNETGWAATSNSSSGSGGGGGVDTKVAMPSYQVNAIGTALYGNYRVGPDVSILGGPNSALPVFVGSAVNQSSPSSYNYGSSIATPIWAGLIADADQDRVANGLATLSTVQTLTALYGTYNTSLYATMFHDVTGGATNSSGAEAVAGYDDLTGLGSPIANVLVPYLGTTAAPEPTSFATVGAATCALLAAGRRRRSSRAPATC
jgi:subtilase family serine protease